MGTLLTAAGQCWIFTNFPTSRTVRVNYNRKMRRLQQNIPQLFGSAYAVHFLDISLVLATLSLEIRVMPSSNVPDKRKNKINLFEQQQVRTVWDEHIAIFQQMQQWRHSAI
jgi:hypothetical protein